MYQGMQNPAPKFNNPLTGEQIKRLQQTSQQFSLNISEEEMLRAICNHRNAEGTGDALNFDPVTGEARCTICGYKFRPIEAEVSSEQIKDDVYRIQDILQTIKLMYIDLPAEAAKDFFPVIALLDKVPQLFDFAAKNMAKHESFGWQYNGKNMGAINMFNNLQNIFGGMMMNQFQQPNPAMNPAMAGMGMPNPQMNPGFGYPGAGMGMSNPAFNAGYAPQTAGYQFVPGQQQVPTPTAPEAPTAPANTTVTETVTV